MINAHSKKLVLVIAAILLLVLLGLPRLVGGSIENATINALLEIVPAEVDSVLTITPEQFQAGWFSSNATISVRYQALDSAPALLLNMDIKHGPVLFTSNGIRLGIAYADIIPSLSGIELGQIDDNLEFSSPDLEFYMLAGFDNSLQIGIGASELQARESATTFQMSGFTGNLSLQGDRSSAAKFSSREVNLTNIDGSFNMAISDASLSSSRLDSEAAISPGQASFTIPRIASSAPLPVVINGLQVDYALSYDNPDQLHLDVSQNFSINELDWDIPLDSLQWNTRISAIDRTLLERYFLLMEEAQNSSINNPGALNSNLAVLGEEFTLLLLQESLAFQSLLEIAAFEGEHKLELTLSWSGLPGLASPGAAGMQAIINGIDARITIEADAAALSRSPLATMVDEYLRQDLLFRENDTIYFKGTLANGELSINNEVFPLDQFLAI